jgi:hypothetical protein
MNELITREQFDDEAMAHAEQMLAVHGIATMKTLLTDPRCGGYDKMPPHLKADMHKRLGLEPVQMFRRTYTSTKESKL